MAQGEVTDLPGEDTEVQEQYELPPAGPPAEEGEPLDQVAYETKLREAKSELEAKGVDIIHEYCEGHEALQFYNLWLSATDELANQLKLEVATLDVANLKQGLLQFQADAYGLPKTTHRMQGYERFTQIINARVKTLDLVALMQAPYIHKGHWTELFAKLGVDPVPEVPYTLQGFMAGDPTAHKTEVEFLARSAYKQSTMQQELDAIIKYWNSWELNFMGEKENQQATWETMFSQTTQIMDEDVCERGIADMQESENALTQILSRSYCGILARDLEKARQDIAEARAVLQLLLTTQKLWANLYSVLTVPIFATSLPKAKGFPAIHEQVVAVLTYVSQEKGSFKSGDLFFLCKNREYILEHLQAVLPVLKDMDRNLIYWLEQKRWECPRLHLITDKELLSLIMAENPLQAITHLLPKLFAGVNSIQMDGPSCIASVTSISGETLKFPNPIPVKGTPDEWVHTLSMAIKSYMHDLIRQASQECAHVVTGVEPLTKAFIEQYPEQIVSMGLRQIWTGWVEGALGIGLSRPSTGLPPSPRGANHSSGMPTTANSARLALLTAPTSLGSREKLNAEGNVRPVSHVSDLTRGHTPGITPPPNRTSGFPVSQNAQNPAIAGSNGGFIPAHLGYRLGSNAPSRLGLAPPRTLSADPKARRSSVPSAPGASSNSMRPRRPATAIGTERRPPNQVVALSLQSLDPPKVSITKKNPSRSSVRAGPLEVSTRMQKTHDMLVEMLHSRLPRNTRDRVQNLMVEQFQLQEEWEKSLKPQKSLNESSIEMAWESQIRHYWNSAEDRCFVMVGTESFEYGTEFLSQRPRLVLGEPAKRAFMTLAMARASGRLGTLIGGPDSGRMAVIEEYAYLTGRWAIPIKTEPTMSPDSMSASLVSIAGLGAWGVLEDIHKLPVPLLQSVTEAVLSTLTKYNRREEWLVLPGDKRAKFRSGFSVFATLRSDMFPDSYGCLPETVKDLLRCSAIRQPPIEAVIKVKLSMAGFSNIDTLSRKVHKLFELCPSQLSTQPHYKWDASFISVVLEQAGLALRNAVAKYEDLILKRTLQLAVIPRLVPEDVPLYLDLLRDVLPGEESVDEAQYMKFQQVLLDELEARALELDPIWKSKVMQIYESQRTHHCFVVLGPPSTGKTTACNVIRSTLTNVLAYKHDNFTINLKTMPTSTMFGHMDSAGKWVDGLLPRIWRQATGSSQKSTDQKWLTVDGPVDPDWMESLNKMIDPNCRYLPLPTGARLSASPNCKIVFELDNLANSSPATGVTCPIICMGSDTLGWQALLSTKISTYNGPDPENFISLVETYILPLLQTYAELAHSFVTTKCKAPAHLSITLAMSTFYSYLSGLASDLLSVSPEYEEDVMVNTFWFCLAWALGGGLGTSEREKFDATYIRPNCNSLPAKDTLYDYYVNMSTGKWVGWGIKSTQPSKLPIVNGRSFVACMDSARIFYLLDKLMAHSQPILITGPACSGKTTVLEAFLIHSQCHTKKVAFHTQMGASELQSLVSEANSQVADRVLRSTLDKDGNAKENGDANGLEEKEERRHVVFIDDVHRASADSSGHQILQESLIYMAEHLGYYSESELGKYKTVSSHLTLMMAASTGSSGDLAIQAKLRGKCNEICLPIPVDFSLKQIYLGVLKVFFNKEAGFSREVLSIVDQVPTLTISAFNTCMNELRGHSPKISQVRLSCISSIVQGILLAPSNQLSNDPITLLSLWRHECVRALVDRAYMPGQRGWVESIIDAHVREMLSGKALKGAPEYFFNATIGSLEVPPKYEPHMETHTVVDLCQSRIKGLNATMSRECGREIVLTPDTMVHTMRLTRTLSMPSGHALLVGVPGIGKRTLARAAAAITLSHKTEEIMAKMCMACTKNDHKMFQKLLEEAYKEACDGRNMVVVVDIDLVPNEIWLEDIHAWITSGMVHGLLPSNAEAKLRLHFVLCFSAYEENVSLMDRFPGFVDHCDVDFFHPWEESSLQQLVHNLLAPTGNAEFQDAFASAFAKLHRQMAEDVPKDFLRQHGVHVMYPLQSLINAVSLFMNLFQKLQADWAKESSINQEFMECLQKLLPVAKTCEKWNQHFKYDTDTTSYAVTTLTTQVERMEGVVQEATEIMKTKLVDIFTLVAFTCYAGPLDVEGRRNLLQKWIPAILGEDMKPTTTNFFPLLSKVLGDPSEANAELCRWQESGIAADSHSIANAYLSKSALRVPLLLDPEGIAEKFVSAVGAQSGVYILDHQSQNFGDKLKTALVYGHRILIKDIPLDSRALALLHPLLESSGRMWHGREAASPTVVLGDGKTYPRHPSFKLYLIMSGPQVPMRTIFHAMCDVINWSVTPEYSCQHLATLAHTFGKAEEDRNMHIQFLEDCKKTVAEGMAAMARFVARANAEGNLEHWKVYRFTHQYQSEINQIMDGVRAQERIEARILERNSAVVAAIQDGPGVSIAKRASILWGTLKDVSKIHGIPHLAYLKFIKLIESSAWASKDQKTAKGETIEDKVTTKVVQRVLRNMPEQSRLLYVFLLAIRIEALVSGMSPGMVWALLRGAHYCELMGLDGSSSLGKRPTTPGSPTASRFMQQTNNEGNPVPASENPCQPWMPNEVWHGIQVLGKNLDSFKNLPDLLQKKEKQRGWRAWWTQWRSDVKIPDMDRISNWERLLLQTIVRPDRTLHSIDYFIKSVLGDKIQGYSGESVKDLFKNIAAEAGPKIPVVFVLPRGMDVYDEIMANCSKPSGSSRPKKGKDTNVLHTTYILTQSVEEEIRQRLVQCLAKGGWLVLRECAYPCHDFLHEIWTTIHRTDKVHSEFRLWITIGSAKEVPEELTDASIFITVPSPTGLRQRLLLQYGVVDEDRFLALQHPDWRIAMYGLLLVNCIVRERNTFPTLQIQGYNKALGSEFGCADAEAMFQHLESKLQQVKSKKDKPGAVAPPQVPWDSIRQIAMGHLIGGVIDSDAGHAQLAAYGEYFLNADVMVSGMQPAPGFSVPFQDGHRGHLITINAYNPLERPEALGLHCNADSVKEVRRAAALLETCSDVLFRDPAFMSDFYTSLVPSKAHILSSIVGSLIQQVPMRWSEATRQEALRKQGGPSPMTKFLASELNAFMKILDCVAGDLERLHRACKSMDMNFADQPQEVQFQAIEILVSMVPAKWQQFWSSPSIVAWFDGLQARFAILDGWLTTGPPMAFWLGGFQHPAGLLTALAQDSVRARVKDEAWTIEKVELRTEITRMTVDDLHRPCADGIYLSGLYTDSFIWNVDHNSIHEPPDLNAEWLGTTYADFPLVKVTPIRRQASNKPTTFQCPVYDSPKRSKLLCHIEVPCYEPPRHWILRGACLYAN